MPGNCPPAAGYGGLVRYANPKMAEKKAAFASGRSEHRILTYCMACRDQFQRAGKDSIHILELACQVEPGPVPDLSLRRANRLKLKEKLQRELWKEEGRMEEMLPVIYMEGAREEMDQRMILESDVKRGAEGLRKLRRGCGGSGKRAGWRPPCGWEM